ncbi:pimeloyl-ACP methyl ester carboxylesterase [Sporosarcina luteola]|nr:pimeloyl-ACP methyl ester carboxylesterase [Sporosarcina luteola]
MLFYSFISVVIVTLATVSLWIVRHDKQSKIQKKSNELVHNGGVSELVELNVNDTTQYILIEGRDRQKPVLLFLHGGPGQPLPFGVSSRGVYPEITKNFIAVYYDQRGAGKSFQNDIPLNSMHVNQFVEDTDDVIDYLRGRFNQNKIYIAAMSWGSIIGMKYIDRYPGKIEAYFGISQFVSNTRSQMLSTKWLFEIAKDKRLKEKLASYGTPPFSMKDEEKYIKYISKYGGENYSDKTISKVNTFSYLKPIFFSPDYTLGDIFKVLYSGAKFSLFESKELQKEIQYSVDLHQELHSIKVPVYLFQGKHDRLTNYDVTKEFFNNLKGHEERELITLEKSAHYPNDTDFQIFINKIIDVTK